MHNETDCDLHSFSGKIICVSDHNMFLTTGKVKDLVLKTYSESDVRHALEEIPQFYNYKSTVFTELGKSKDCLTNVGKESWAEVFY